MSEKSLELFYQVLALSSILAFVTAGVMQAVKEAFTIKKNVIPLLTIFVGAALGFLMIPIFPSVAVPILVWAGALSGSAGVGVHETFKKREGYSKE